MNLPRALAFALVCLMTGLPGAAQAKDLHWRSLDVRAQLDAEGALHVRETQAIVFNGDWNGGERTFSIRDGQRLRFERLVEKDAGGRTVREFHRGDLDDIGEFKWFGSHVLRWRARLPQDPPFRDALRVYELDYVIAGVLQRQDGRYYLNHDFAFPDRFGIIEHLHAELALDPSWRLLNGRATSFDIDALPPGEGAVRGAVFEFVGTGHPLAQGEVRAAPAWFADLLCALLLALVLGGAGVVIRRERERGRFEPLDSPDSIDAAWLGEHLLRYPPEDVGAAWDGDVSTHEVMAILARMSQAKQLTSEVRARGWWLFKTQVLHLKLNVDVGSLPATEQALMRKLFFDGNTTDTDRIREHYRARGFSPAGVIEKYLKPRAAKLVGLDEARPSWHWKVAAGLIGVGMVLIAVGAMLEPRTALILMVLLGTAGPLAVAVQFARAYRNAPDARFLPAFAVVLIVGGILWGLRWAFRRPDFTAIECIGVALVAAGMLYVVLLAFMCRRGAEDLRRRRRLLAARKYFQRELRKASPRLEDAWLPYLLAFGLGPDVDRWFKVAGPAAVGSTSGFGGSSGHGGISSTSAWTGGGGGTFAGAGATGSWVSAVGTLAAGVSAPSSGGGSSGGGGSGGGGGGGGSGGGGGGGW